LILLGPATPLEGPGQRRQHHENHHGENVLDDQPTDGDVTLGCFEFAVVHEHADQDDRTGDRNRQPGNQSLWEAPTQKIGGDGPQQCGDHDLPNRPGEGNMPDRPEFAEVEVEPHPEHQQHDADLAELHCHLFIFHQAEHSGTDDDAGQQISHDGRKPYPLGDEPQDGGNRQPGGQEDEEFVVLHRFEGSSRWGVSQ
jgi:hypothetical protein